MSFTLGNGWDSAFGYFSIRGYRSFGQRHHCGSRKWRSYDLPEPRVAFMSRPCGGLRSWRRGLYRPSVEEARRRRFYRAMDRNPLYYANIADRPAGALRFGYPYGWYMPAKIRERVEVEMQAEHRRLAASETRTISVTLSGYGWQEIDDLLANSTGPAMPEDPGERTLKWLVTSLLAHWGDGWRRSGSWERTMLDMMGHAND